MVGLVFTGSENCFTHQAQCLECWTDVNCVTDAKIGNTLPLPRVELFGLITVTVMAETEARVHSERGNTDVRK